MIYQAIYDLTEYGYFKGIIEKTDKKYIRNNLMDLFKLSVFPDDINCTKNTELEVILNIMLEYAIENHLIDGNTITKRDLFDTKVMGLLTPRPSYVIDKFYKQYENSPEDATNYFYKLCLDDNYIRTYRVKNDLRWKTETEYGNLDITINLSKPEKDPRDIAAAKKIEKISYPKCQLCVENEGYSGRINHPARQNLRIIPIKLSNQEWGFQYSPYVYYNEHCIILNSNHIPMKIDENTFNFLLDFVDKFPHYFVGSNADLPIVGGSILTHNHFQGGRYEFAMQKANIEKYYKIPKYEDIEVGIVKWPLSDIRLRHKSKNKLISLASHILTKWQNYTNSNLNIFSNTKGELHNTLTPIAYKKNNYYILDLVLRNNLTTNEFPLGLFHPHSNLHHIKKENIGLIEVMGLAVLPSRLCKEMKLIKNVILDSFIDKNVFFSDQYNNEKLKDKFLLINSIINKIKSNKQISKHAEWVNDILSKYSDINKQNIDDILRYEIGIVFLNVLEDAGVFKRNNEGMQGLDEFITSL